MVNSAGILIGIVTIDDVLKVSQIMATREVQRIGGSEVLDGPYMKIALTRMVRKRAGGLVILFFGEMFPATAMGFFEKEIQKAVVLGLFVPLIISSGGNSGSQDTTLVIRALALGELRLKDWWRVMRREVMTGLALGGILGFLRISIWSALSHLYSPHWLLVTITVAMSLIGIVMWGCVAGSMSPLIPRGANGQSFARPIVCVLTGP